MAKPAAALTSAIERLWFFSVLAPSSFQNFPLSRPDLARVVPETVFEVLATAQPYAVAGVTTPGAPPGPSAFPALLIRRDDVALR
ncbi:hypothetical protein MALGJ_15770 [Mycolicibacter algericus]|uniref:Uncharacterized protein n=1 Tax=Mycolicibacter algericus TaxID=1288388 RepID=A0A7I9Y894_MYCAL|nr:hypothetical protein MALGJ_15770 [Mycolicibacter algericus]